MPVRSNLNSTEAGYSRKVAVGHVRKVTFGWARTNTDELKKVWDQLETVTFGGKGNSPVPNEQSPDSIFQSGQNSCRTVIVKLQKTCRTNAKQIKKSLEHCRKV